MARNTIVCDYTWSKGSARMNTPGKEMRFNSHRKFPSLKESQHTYVWSGSSFRVNKASSASVLPSFAASTTAELPCDVTHHWSIWGTEAYNECEYSPRILGHWPYMRTSFPCSCNRNFKKVWSLVLTRCWMTSLRSWRKQCTEIRLSHHLVLISNVRTWLNESNNDSEDLPDQRPL